MLLNEAKVKNSKPKAKMYRLSDGDGLYLQITPMGGKYWRLRYFYSGKEKMLALGTYPEVTLGEARDKRHKARKALAEGTDPGAKKQEAKRLAVFNAENTFEAVAKEWFETNKPQWTPDHAERLWRRIDLHLVTHLGKCPIAEITSLDVLDVIRKIESRGTTEVSHRVLQTCGVIFRYAVVTRRAKFNPVPDLRGALKPHKAKNYPTITAKQIPELLKRLEQAKTSDQNKIAVRLLMLTFVRTGELRQAKWEDIDLKAKEWRLPAHTTKMKDEHIVPLSKQAIKLFEELKTMTGKGELVFPPQQRRRHLLMSENTINQLLKRMGYRGKLVGHGFRALASTTLNEMGYPADVIERQLAHAERNKVRAAYNRAEYLPQRTAMMQTWADVVDGVVRDRTIILGKFGKRA
jgi:integrase